MKRPHRLDFCDQTHDQRITWARIATILAVLLLIGLGVQQILQLQPSDPSYRINGAASGLTASSALPHRDTTRLRASSNTLEYSSSHP